MQAGSRVYSAWLIVALCFLLPGCDRPGFVSDQRLKDFFSKNRADFDELARLMQSQPLGGEIRTDWRDKGPPKPPADAATWHQIHDLLTRIHALSIARTQDKVTVEEQNALGFEYWFDYRATAPPGLVPSLEEKTQPYKPRGVFTMRLDGDWYVCVLEGD